MAYRVGDMDAYEFASGQFVRELCHLFLKQRGQEYFRHHQPWHSIEFMGEEVFLTRLERGTTGWEMDGPGYPAQSPLRLYNQRWSGFRDPDSARFYHEYLQEDVRRELGWLQARGNSAGSGQGESISPLDWIQLRSALLNESASTLAASAGADLFTPSRLKVLGNCLALLRGTRPVHFQRLIPPAAPDPFTQSLDPVRGGPAEGCWTTVGPAAKPDRPMDLEAAWPSLTWTTWQTPAGGPWTFGTIRPGGMEQPKRVRRIALNWNTEIIACDGE